MDNPLVTIIMPVRNEEHFIARSLGAVLAQRYPADRMEILVADGESDDATRTVIAHLPDTARVRIIANPRRTQAAGMNAALAVAQGEVVIRVDGHSVIAPDYVAACVAELKRTEAHNVGGSMIPVGTTAEGKAIAAACASPFAVPTAFHVGQAGQFTDTVYLGAWPRWVLDRVGGYDTRMILNEDYELNVRIRQAGGRIYLSPAIQSRYYGRQTLGALARQYFRYGRAKVGALRKAPTSLRPRQLVAPAFVTALVAVVPLAIASLAAHLGWLFVAWLAVMLAYVALNLAFAFVAARRAGMGLFWRIPPAFATIHVAWGAGFWAGVVSRSPRVPQDLDTGRAHDPPEAGPTREAIPARINAEPRGW